MSILRSIGKAFGTASSIAKAGNLKIGTLEGQRLQNPGNALYSTLRSEFCNYAVGPWVLVAWLKPHSPGETRL